MLIDDKLLNKVSVEAQASPRLRIYFNLHESLDDKYVYYFLKGIWHSVEF